MHFLIASLPGTILQGQLTCLPFISWMALAASSGAEKRRKPVHLLAPVLGSTRILLDTTFPNSCPTASLPLNHTLFLQYSISEGISWPGTLCWQGSYLEHALQPDASDLWFQSPYEQIAQVQPTISHLKDRGVHHMLFLFHSTHIVSVC